MVTLAKRPAPMSHRSDSWEARCQVEVYCQSLVDAGIGDWRVNARNTELIMDSGEVYVFAELGVTRLR
jgi:hypothetical protein